MNCSICSANISVSAGFCSNCGAPVENEKFEVTTDEKDKANKSSKWLKVWLLVVGFSLIGTLSSLYLLAYAGESTSNPPVGLYTIIWTSLFFYLVWKLRGYKAWKGTFVGMGVGFLAYTGALIVADNHDTLAKEKAAAETIDHMLDMSEEYIEDAQKLNPDGTAALIERPFAPRPEATGSMLVFEQVMVDILNQTAELTNEYAQELELIGYFDLLEEHHLESDPTFEKSRLIIAETRVMSDKYEDLANQIVLNVRQSIESLDLSDVERRSFLKGFDNGVAGGQEINKRGWELDRLTTDEIEQIINLLAEDPNTWLIEDGQFVFETDQQISRFNSHIANLQKITDEQTKSLNSNIERQRQKFE